MDNVFTVKVSDTQSNLSHDFNLRSVVRECVAVILEQGVQISQIAKFHGDPHCPVEVFDVIYSRNVIMNNFIFFQVMTSDGSVRAAGLSLVNLFSLFIATTFFSYHIPLYTVPKPPLPIS